MWDNILEEIKNFMHSSNGSSTWFRGQKIQPENQLNFALFREGCAKINDILVLEKQYYNFFKHMGHVYHNASDWNLLFMMQHYGVHTRLLDWTESFAVALYFASLDWGDDDPISIWLLKPQLLNKKTLNDHHLFTIDNDSYRDRLYMINGKKFESGSVAIYPVRNNMRIVVQQGVFTIQGNKNVPLERELSGCNDVLKRIEIPPSCKQDVKMFLYLSGVNDFSLFPDLDGLARCITKKMQSK